MNLIDLSDIKDRNLGRILYLQSTVIPDKPCYQVGDRVFTYKETNTIVNRYAQGLKGLGIEKNDRVVIYMRSCVEFIFMAFAVNKLGAIWVPMNGDYKGTWLKEGIEDSKGKVLVTDTDKLPRLQEAFGDSMAYGQLVVNVLEGATCPEGATHLASFDALDDIEENTADIFYGDTCSILWTSGTTGKSKGVLQSHNVWLNAAESVQRQFGTEEHDVVYNCLPLYNTGAWVTSVYRALTTGICVALDEMFSARHFWERIKFYKATETTTLGAMHMFLWNAEETPEDADNTLRNANVIPLPPQMTQPFMQRFGIKKVQKGYGQSEACSIMNCLEDGIKEWAPNSLGDVARGIELSIFNDEGEEVPPGTPGEFCLKPTKPYVIFNGYFENEAATQKAYYGEWYRTGDLGMKDGEGNYYFLDRKSDFIRDKGRNISSLQVEAAVMQHPDVEAVACFGLPSEFIETEVEMKLDIILKAGSSATEETIARYINDNAPYFFVPRYMEFVTELPYTPTNKVQKFKLREKGVTPTTWDRTKTDFQLIK